MLVSGAVLAGISFAQHEHHDHALAAYAARTAQIDRNAAAEAQRSRATALVLTAENRVAQEAAAQAAAVKAAQRAQAARAAQEAEVAPQEQAARQEQAAQRKAQRAKKSGAAKRAKAARAQKAQTAPHHPASGVRQGSVSEIRGSGATLVIPALGVHAPVVATGAVNGSMTIPRDVHTVGWYDGVDINNGQTVNFHEPWPGQPGVSLLAGHINWVGQGPGALYYISHLVVGDPVEVIGSNGVATHWTVSEAPITVLKANLPANLFVNTGPPKLAMVTCGGPYDATTHHYLDNVVVWATPASQ